MSETRMGQPSKPRRRALTVAEQTFCERFVVGGNGTQAVIDAFANTQRWKRRSAGRKAVDLLKRPEIVSRIRQLERRALALRDAHFDALLAASLEEPHAAFGQPPDSIATT